jgi:hypothetical protein
MSKSVKNIQYVIPIWNAWMVESANRAKFSLIADNKRDAVAFAKELARNNKSDLIIYGKKGQILSTISFRSMAKA